MCVRGCGRVCVGGKEVYLGWLWGDGEYVLSRLRWDHIFYSNKSFFLLEVKADVIL